MYQIFSIFNNWNVYILMQVRINDIIIKDDNHNNIQG